MSSEPPPDGDPPEGSAAAEGAGDGVETIETVEIQTEMEQSFLDYAMSVIVARALPDVRDGLKPVHRRILWSMASSGHRHDRGHVKCATVVGDVIARYHPHGDTAVYDALVRMGQDFSLRHLLVDPHGNFGSPADPPAAYRYTECRLAELSAAMLDGIDEDTVDFLANFDGRHREPEVLPSRFPNLLVNGSQGIAVGMATNIPPHNLGEVVDAVLHVLERPDATTEELMQFVRGPDFPTGGQILGRAGIEEAYRTGRGTLRLRGQAEIVTEGRATRIVVSQIPYQVSVEAIERRAAQLVESKVLTGIRDIRNESAKGRTRLVFELTRDAPALVILNNLYKHTPLQVSFSVNMVALADGVPRTLSLPALLQAYVAHQIEVVTPPLGIPPRTGQRAGAHRRGPAAGGGHAGRGDRPHPLVSRSARSPHRSHGRAVRLLRGAGQPHPGHTAGAPHPSGSQRAGHRAGRAAGDHRRTGGHPG